MKRPSSLLWSLALASPTLSQPQQPISLSSHLSFNFSSPAPYVFSSVYSLLQQWPNSFFPNGHTIAACEIPRHTVLYHGRHDAEMPPSPEWLSFDVEMAYAIMGNLPDSRMLTYRTTKPVKALYFDGMSANLMSPGIEAQMTFLYGDSKSVPNSSLPGPPGRGGRGPRPPAEGEMEDGPPRFGRWNPLEDEYFRAQGLCKWVEDKGLGGKGWGYEGVVRMNAAFEVIWCNFGSPSLQLVSNLNVSAPRIEMAKRGGRQEPGDARRTPVNLLGRREEASNRASPILGSMDAPEGPHGPGMTDPSEPFREFASWGWFTAAARHYGFSGMGPGRGEARAKVDTCGLFTFYDPALEGQDTARIDEDRKSLNISKAGSWTGPSDEEERQAALEQLMRRRRPHRTNHVSKADGKFMRSAVEDRLRNALNDASCSGIDWQLTSHEILITYASGLHNLLNLLSPHQPASATKWLTQRTWLESLRTQTHWFLVPFLEYPPQPYTPDSLKRLFSPQSPSAKAAFSRCKDQYSVSDPSTLAEGEHLLAWATDEILSGICAAVVDVGMAVEYAWLRSFNKEPELHDDDEDFDGRALNHGARKWRHTVEELMAWLGWVDQWTGCEGPCAMGEFCYIPMWPANGRPHGGGPGGPGGPGRRPGRGGGDGERGPPGKEAWGDEEKFLWNPVCVNISSFPPE